TVLRKMDNQFLDLFFRNAEIERTAHVNAQFGSPAQRKQCRHRDERACFGWQTWATPDVAEHLVVEKIGEALVELFQIFVAGLGGFFAEKRGADFHPFFCSVLSHDTRYLRMTIGVGARSRVCLRVAAAFARDSSK